MYKFSPKYRLPLFAIGALALLVLAPAQAEIYKWLDTSGKTHYTENRDEAGKGKAEQVKIQTQPSELRAAVARSWQDQEQESKQRLAQQQMAQPSRSAPPSNSQSSWAPQNTGGAPETDASRCARAQNDNKIINSGTGIHRGGAKIDANDREVAARDIRSFCR
ncbi:DUF4124 domain-containing protein [Undibacterium sp.]|uniref:DUF4124 domain-containing protein n=1 Tax=Undibacterium sp. TaxID=1914977 RepID=UPI0025D750BA|nr:DUF4124 domain-containing protein [Undibacterium sp.]